MTNPPLQSIASLRERPEALGLSRGFPVSEARTDAEQAVRSYFAGLARDGALGPQSVAELKRLKVLP